MEQSGIAIQHINRRGQTYYLYHRRSKAGAPQYHFSRKSNGGGPVDEIPEGYEIYEKPGGQVFLRRRKPRLISDEELATLRQVLDRQPHRPFFLLEEEDGVVTVHHAEDHGLADDPVRRMLYSPEDLRRQRAARADYMPVMRFILTGSSPRRFGLERYCFRGSVDDWIPLAGPDELAELAEKFLPHIGRDSFFELSPW
jgi:hypothetical protein